LLESPGKGKKAAAPAAEFYARIRSPFGDQEHSRQLHEKNSAPHQRGLFCPTEGSSLLESPGKGKKAAALAAEFYARIRSPFGDQEHSRQLHNAFRPASIMRRAFFLALRKACFQAKAGKSPHFAKMQA